jgi:hypothetical protein
MYEDTIKDAVEYIIKLALCGRGDVLRILELYAEGYGPAAIARYLKMPRSTVRSYVQRINERVVFVNVRRFLRMTLPYVKMIEPIVVDGGRCSLCNKRFESFSSLLVHISFRHRKLVELYVNRFFVYAKLGGVDESAGS